MEEDVQVLFDQRNIVSDRANQVRDWEGSIGIDLGSFADGISKSRGADRSNVRQPQVAFQPFAIRGSLFEVKDQPLVKHRCDEAVVNFGEGQDKRFGLIELPSLDCRVLERLIIRREQVPENFQNIVGVLVERGDTLLEFLQLGKRQFAMDRSPAKTLRVDGREFFDHAVDEFRRVDPVGSVEPFPQLVDVWDIRKCIGQDALFDHIDPLLLDRVLDNLFPIQQARIEFRRQLGSFVFLRSRVGAGDLELALQVFDRRVGIRRVFEDRLAGLHTAGQVVLAMFCDPFIQQASGLGNPSLVLGVKGLEEKILRGVGDQFG